MWNDLAHLSRLREYRSYRASTENDDFASNEDYWFIEPGQTRSILDISGCGFISHIWLTTPSAGASSSWYAGSLETTELRIYWDGQEKPGVQVPLGGFFCAPFDTAREFVSAPIVLAPLDGRGFNMYFPMPFSSGARMELVNNSSDNPFRIYFHIDYALYDDPALVAGQGRFHAYYHNEHLTSDSPYTILRTTGRGQYIGCVLWLDTGIRKDRDGYAHEMMKRYPDSHYARYWWEGDDRMIIDGQMAIRGTGTEDYFGSAWSYASQRPFTAPLFGCVMNGYDAVNPGLWCLYRWHIDQPVVFRESIDMTIEHGHNNAFLDAPYHSIAYWYQQPVEMNMSGV